MRVNGEDRALAGPCTLEQFLEQAGYCAERVVVEKNGAIVPAGRFADEKLADNDVLEVFGFIGGG
jgi:thiamine biosynthesis protein ThiS